MSGYIIILSTVIHTPMDLQHIHQAIVTFHGVSEWSVDLEDCDQILRVACTENIGLELVKSLERMRVSSSVLEVFDENGISLQNFVST
ncbi:hypothetical protein [Pedobacter caeni]|nr:hypothetical protein [Pedobacter caeni]